MSVDQDDAPSPGDNPDLGSDSTPPDLFQSDGHPTGENSERPPVDENFGSDCDPEEQDTKKKETKQYTSGDGEDSGPQVPDSAAVGDGVEITAGDAGFDGPPNAGPDGSVSGEPPSNPSSFPPAEFEEPPKLGDKYEYTYTYEEYYEEVPAPKDAVTPAVKADKPSSKCCLLL
jgi:hypothetical protein